MKKYFALVPLFIAAGAHAARQVPGGHPLGTPVARPIASAFQSMIAQPEFSEVVDRFPLLQRLVQLEDLEAEMDDDHLELLTPFLSSNDEWNFDQRVERRDPGLIRHVADRLENADAPQREAWAARLSEQGSRIEDNLGMSFRIAGGILKLRPEDVSPMTLELDEGTFEIPMPESDRSSLRSREQKLSRLALLARGYFPSGAVREGVTRFESAQAALRRAQSEKDIVMMRESVRRRMGPATLAGRPDLQARVAGAGTWGAGLAVLREADAQRFPFGFQARLAASDAAMDEAALRRIAERQAGGSLVRSARGGGKRFVFLRQMPFAVSHPLGALEPGLYIVGGEKRTRVDVEFVQGASSGEILRFYDSEGNAYLLFFPEEGDPRLRVEPAQGTDTPPRWSVEGPLENMPAEAARRAVLD